MIPVAQLKKDLQASLDLADIIDVLKMIASSEFRNVSTRVEQEDSLMAQLNSCFDLLAFAPEKNIFLTEREDLPKAYIMICTDEGFVGEINTVVVEEALRDAKGGGNKFIVIGERGERLLNDSGVQPVAFLSPGNDIKMQDTKAITDYIMELYTNREIGSVYAIYMKFFTFTKHNLEIQRLLPCSEALEERSTTKTRDLDVLIIPNAYSVTEYLAKMWLGNNIYNILWSSKLSEWSIRVMQLEHSADELKDINKDLKFKYFKSVHSLNDKVIREIFAARAAG